MMSAADYYDEENEMNQPMISRDLKISAELVTEAGRIYGVTMGAVRVIAKPWGCRLLTDTDAVMTWMMEAIKSGVNAGAI